MEEEKEIGLVSWCMSQSGLVGDLRFQSSQPWVLDWEGNSLGWLLRWDGVMGDGCLLTIRNLEVLSVSFQLSFLMIFSDDRMRNLSLSSLKFKSNLNTRLSGLVTVNVLVCFSHILEN